MLLVEKAIEIPAVAEHGELLAYFAEEVPRSLGEDFTPLRFAMTGLDESAYRCEVGVITRTGGIDRPSERSVFDFARRPMENTDSFNAVLVIPTGIGAEIGGHAGDAAPVAGLLATVCDNLITHPNVVNASDINEMPENALYVEGSVLSRLMMGTVGLQKVRSNRVLVVIDAHPEERFVSAGVNSVSAARATYGLLCPRVVVLDPPMKLLGRHTPSGRAAGRVEGLDGLCSVLDEYRGQYDAVALSSVVDVPADVHMDYVLSRRDLVNPWGGAEAILTHAVSAIYDVPSAHAPMMESSEIASLDPGYADPRIAAELVSMTFLQCVLKGLHRAPRVISERDAMWRDSVITAVDLSCLVIPDGCVGLPTLAALEQGIPVIAVRENRSLMQNDLRALPWAADQLHVVENYWEALGVMAAIKSGMAPESVRRPIQDTRVDARSRSTSAKRDADT